MYDRAEAAVLRMVPRDECSICWDTVLDCDMAGALRIALEKAKACAPTDLKARIRCRGGSRAHGGRLQGTTGRACAASRWNSVACCAAVRHGALERRLQLRPGGCPK